MSRCLARERADAEAGGLPPAVGSYCGRYSLTVRTVQPQGDHWQATLVV